MKSYYSAPSQNSDHSMHHTLYFKFKSFNEVLLYQTVIQDYFFLQDKMCINGILNLHFQFTINMIIILLLCFPDDEHKMYVYTLVFLTKKRKTKRGKL